MGKEWSKQTFRSLYDFWRTHESSLGLNEEELELMDRYEDIIRMVEGGRIWPPVASSWRSKFDAALSEVLSRLPQETFNQVESEIGFILEDPSGAILAENVPAPLAPDAKKLGIDTVVFFRACLNFAPDALVGLIAHEIAHSFARGRNYQEDEAMVVARAREWGFGRELDCLESAKKAGAS